MSQTSKTPSVCNKCLFGHLKNIFSLVSDSTGDVKGVTFSQQLMKGIEKGQNFFIGNALPA